jgi:DNA helicase-2/ATP-dependent DNA helicase PcrA
MRRLLITSAKYRAVRGLRERTIPSRFLNELPTDGVAFRDESDAGAEFEYEQPPRGAGGESARRPSGPRGAASANAARKNPLAGVRGSKASAPAGDSQYPAGCKVRHPQFGVGTVQSVTGLGVNRRATIAFLQAGTKTLVLQYARLERV